jgi:hypothetical protein
MVGLRDRVIAASTGSASWQPDARPLLGYAVWDRPGRARRWRGGCPPVSISHRRGSRNTWRASWRRPAETPPMSGTGMFALYQIAGTKRVNVGSRSQTAPIEAAIRSPYERCPDLALGGWGARRSRGCALSLGKSTFNHKSQNGVDTLIKIIVLSAAPTVESSWSSRAALAAAPCALSAAQYAALYAVACAPCAAPDAAPCRSAGLAVLSC